VQHKALTESAPLPLKSVQSREIVSQLQCDSESNCHDNSDNEPITHIEADNG